MKLRSFCTEIELMKKKLCNWSMLYWETSLDTSQKPFSEKGKRKKNRKPNWEDERLWEWGCTEIYISYSSRATSFPVSRTFLAPSGFTDSVFKTNIWPNSVQALFETKRRLYQVKLISESWELSAFKGSDPGNEANSCASSRSQSGPLMSLIRMPVPVHPWEHEWDRSFCSCGRGSI